MNGKIEVYEHEWEFVVGHTFVAVKMCPRGSPAAGLPVYAPFYSFVMERASEDVRDDVRREIERRYPELIGRVNG